MVFRGENIKKNEEFQCFVENIETLYNLEFDQQTLKTKSFSFYENEIPVKILDCKTIQGNQNEIKHEVKVPIFLPKFSHLKNKRLKMVKFLAQHRLECDINIGGISSEDEDEEDEEYEEESDDLEDIEDIESDSFDYSQKTNIQNKPIFCNEGELFNSNVLF